MTIEERANKLTDFSLHDGIKGTIRHTYIYAATEQRTIDIDKACEWLDDNARHLLSAELRQQFRKAMEKE